MSQARPRLTLLSPEQIEKVHEASLRILLEHAVGVKSERARRVFGGARGEVSGTRQTEAPPARSGRALRAA